MLRGTFLLDKDLMKGLVLMTHNSNNNFSKADHLFQHHLSKRQCTFHFKKGGGVRGRGWGGGEILLKTIMAIHRFDVVQTGVENL